MSYEAIIYEKKVGYGILTLNQPKSLNALGKQIFLEVTQVIKEVSADTEVNALIITGAPRPDGRPCFSSGVNLKDIMERGFLPQLPLFDAIRSISTGILSENGTDDGLFWEIVAHCPKITIAAIDGICSAGGLELALVCDIIVVSETAQIGDLHMKNMGGIGNAGVTVNMARRIGVPWAIELVSTSDFIDGKEAHRINLANHLYAPDKMMEGAMALAKKIGSMPPEAVMMVKAACNSVYNMNYRDAWRYSGVCSAVLHATPKSDVSAGQQNK